MNKPLISCIIICLLAISSCKKDQEPSREDILTNGTWRVTSNKLTVILAGAPVTIDRYAIEQPCQQDNLSIFRDDHHLISDEGAVACTPGGPQQSDQGTWVFSDNDTRLTIEGIGSTRNYTVSSIDGGSMVLQLDSAFLGIPVQTIITYEHQN